jgi:hypothetical protein
VRSARLWARLLGLVKVVVEGVEFDETEQAVVVSVRPRKATKRRCGRCGKRCSGYDQGNGAAPSARLFNDLEDQATTTSTGGRNPIFGSCAGSVGMIR